MANATGSAQLKKLFTKRDDVVCNSGRLQLGIQSVHQPLILGRHPGRTVPRMTALGLNATDRHKRFSADVYHVATQGEGEQCRLREAELAGADKHDVVL